EQDFFSHVLRRNPCFTAANPAAAENNVTVINYRSLSGSYSALRLAQSHAGAIVLECGDRRTGPGMIISDLDRRFQPRVFPPPGARMPVRTIDLKLFASQVIWIANNPAIGCRIEIHHVTRTRRTAGKSFALANREQFDAAVFADEVSLNIVNCAAMKFALAQMRTQKRLVIVSGNKTNLLAVNLVGDLQA